MRHAKIKKRITPPDTIYNSVIIAKLINYIMMSGKKTVAQDQIYAALVVLAKKGKMIAEVRTRAADTTITPGNDFLWRGRNEYIIFGQVYGHRAPAGPYTVVDNRNKTIAKVTHTS